MKKTIIIALVLFSLIPTFAQDNLPFWRKLLAESSPLLELLAFVPDNEVTREGMVAFADVEAAFQARPGIPLDDPTFFSDPLNHPRSDLYIWTLPDSLPPDIRQNLIIMLDEGTTETIGLEATEITQTLAFGAPPAAGMILGGDFDEMAIINAHQNRDYSSEEVPQGVLLCGDVGCEGGYETDIPNRDVTNPFGGNLGRQFPLIVGDDVIFSSPAFELLQGMGLDGVTTLADALDFISSVRALESMGVIIQAQFFPSIDFLSYPNTLNFETGELDQLPGVESYNEFPPYIQVAVGHVVDENTEIGVMALVFTDVESAEVARAELGTRLQTAVSLVRQTAFSEIWDLRGHELSDLEIYTDNSTGLSVLLMPLSNPVPGSDLVDGRVVQTGLAFRLWLDMVFARDTYWMAAIPPLSIEND